PATQPKRRWPTEDGSLVHAADCRSEANSLARIANDQRRLQMNLPRHLRGVVQPRHEEIDCRIPDLCRGQAHAAEGGIEVWREGMVPISDDRDIVGNRSLRLAQGAIDA